MDSEKTGQVIAACRAERNMTQKQLAERLHISDRTISRWERGAGFPDLSLLEPLADALGLSVVELLRGERIPPAEQLVPESERSLRETFRALALRLRRFRRWRNALGILLLAAVAAFLLLWFAPSRYFSYPVQTVTASQALDICPFAIITTEEYALAGELLEDRNITRCLTPEAEADPQNDAEDIFRLPREAAARYLDQIHIEGNTVDSLEITVLAPNIFIDYSSGTDRCILEILSDGTLRKTACRLEKDGGADLAVVNENNTGFHLIREHRDLLAPFRS